ncbi:hypothetical protein Hanom_Chr13g01243041 [Helianthus anomalus]
MTVQSTFSTGGFAPQYSAHDFHILNPPTNLGSALNRTLPLSSHVQSSFVNYRLFLAFWGHRPLFFPQTNVFLSLRSQPLFVLSLKPFLIPIACW